MLISLLWAQHKAQQYVVIFHLRWQYQTANYLRGAVLKRVALLLLFGRGEHGQLWTKNWNACGLKMFDKDYWKAYMCVKDIVCTVVNKIIKNDDQHQLPMPSPNK